MKALVVEDNRNMLELLEMALIKNNFTVDCVMDGQSAFEKAQENKYDVIILDIVLPVQTGFSVISSLRAIGNNTPILAISANNEVAARIKAINLGADDFLVKEFVFEELIARVKSLLRRKAERKNNVFYHKDLVLNMTDVSVYCKRRKITVTKKEFQILLLLLRNKNRVVTREEFIELLWNKHDFDVHSNKIDVHVLTLRRKLGECGNFIETIRGYGYIIRD